MKMLGEHEKKCEKNFVKIFLKATEQIRKRLLPGSGETDCSISSLVVASGGAWDGG